MAESRLYYIAKNRYYYIAENDKTEDWEFFVEEIQ
jgi:hypothetical protein